MTLSIKFPEFRRGKMNVIAVETSTRMGGVALWTDDGLVEEMRFSSAQPASQSLLPAIHSLLKRSGLALDQIMNYAVTIGPGSFTGLRVGLATVKTLAYFTSRPVITIPTLDVLVAPLVPVDKPVLAIMDARKSEVYGSLYRLTKNIERISEQRVCRVEFLLKGLKEAVVVGDAIDIYRELIIEILPGAVFAPPDLAFPSPSWVAKLALSGAYPIFQGQELFNITPVYIRRSEAEMQWETKHGST